MGGGRYDHGVTLTYDQCVDGRKAVGVSKDGADMQCRSAGLLPPTGGSRYRKSRKVRRSAKRVNRRRKSMRR